MNYIPLTNKWRPQTFDDIVGQYNILFTLKNSIKNNKIHNSYLFSGPYGTGKTTLARVFSKSLNCTNIDKINPCNECDSCKNVNLKNNIDIIEINAALKTKVDNIRDLIISTNYAPIHSRYKIYIIDEVHMLSINSFNALLKNLEEPNKYTKYILVTTKLTKIPDTILSRCLNFNLKKISDKDIFYKLIKILKNENIEYDNNAIKYIPTFSNGSLRDAINILEKATIQRYKKITYKNIKTVLNIPTDNILILLIYSVYKKDINNIMKYVEILYKNDIDFYNVLLQFQFLLHKLIIYKITKKYNNITIKIKNLLEKITVIKLKEYYELIIQGKKYLIYSPNIKLSFEMILINMTIK